MGTTTARSVRVADTVWERAKNRAAYDGTNISKVINALLEGYSKGLLDLPRVEVHYTQPRETAK
jgi:hypothetical protein